MAFESSQPNDEDPIDEFTPSSPLSPILVEKPLPKLKLVEQKAEDDQIEAEERSNYEDNCADVIIVRSKSNWWCLPKNEITPRDYNELSMNGCDEESRVYLTDCFNGKWSRNKRIGPSSDLELDAAHRKFTLIYCDWLL